MLLWSLVLKFYGICKMLAKVGKCFLLSDPVYNVCKRIVFVCVLLSQVFVLNCAPQSPLLPTLHTVIHVLFQLFCTVSQSVSLLRYDSVQVCRFTHRWAWVSHLPSYLRIISSTCWYGWGSCPGCCSILVHWLTVEGMDVNYLFFSKFQYEHPSIFTDSSFIMRDKVK